MLDDRLEKRLRHELEGDVRFDRGSRARYSTDASIYQVTPVGVALPRTTHDIQRIVQIAADADISITPRGGGTSQGGQCIGPGLIVDDSRYLTSILDLDVENRRCRVEPGIVLDDLNRQLRPHGLFFPVDISTANRATLGGMTGNNSAGTRSIRYGIMADNVAGVDVTLADGRNVTFAEGKGGRDAVEMMSLYLRAANEFTIRVPNVLRHVAGYNLHRMGVEHPNPAEVFVGSEGTLGMFTAIELKLRVRPAHRVLGIAHFEKLRQAMDATQYIVELNPSAVELVDRKLIDLARVIPEFTDPISSFVQGQPEGLLFVEFSGEDPDALDRDLIRLDEMLADRGLSDTVTHATTEAEQTRVWDVRKAGLNIVMSMKGDEKPVSFIEDCTVPLDRLAEYHDRLNDVFARNGTTGTWYAHASVGCLHVRPALNLKLGEGVQRMRAIAEQAHEIVREFGGSVSGEHGDGLVRSEFIEPMLGETITRTFADLKAHFDPDNRFNPGKIVNPARMDDRSLFRYQPGYEALPADHQLDWSDWSGLLGAVEMCNNNGACRKQHDGSMCPSYRVTNDEIDSTRGRANTLRLAMTGQLGSAGLTAPEIKEAMDLCVGCKACRRECPTGVDMARMKIEAMAAHREEYGTSRRDYLFANLPRLAPLISRAAPLANLRNGSALLRKFSEKAFGLSAERELPEWASYPFQETGEVGPEGGRLVVLFVDTFDRYFEPENVRAAVAVLNRAGYRVALPEPTDNHRPLCCGRTYLNAGLIDKARAEAIRCLDTFAPYLANEVPIVGLEPSCLLTFRDEFTAMLPDRSAQLAQNAMLLEEFIVRENEAGRWTAPFKRHDGPVLVHGHCHQKAFGLGSGVIQALNTVPGVNASMIESSCCGMAGSFGYENEHLGVSKSMAELSLAPAVRAASKNATILADGVSCRHQIFDTTGRSARHVVRFLMESLK